VAVLGAVSEPDVPVLRRMQAHTTTSLAFALDVGAWGGAAGASAAPLLAGQGWRAVSLRPRDRIEAAWQELGSRSVGRSVGARTGAGAGAGSGVGSDSGSGR
jgi:hypothetical protein